MTVKRKVFVVSGPDGYLYSDFVAVEFPEELFYRFSNYSTEKVRRNTRDGYRVVEFEEVIQTARVVPVEEGE